MVAPRRRCPPGNKSGGSRPDLPIRRRDCSWRHFSRAALFASCRCEAGHLSGLVNHSPTICPIASLRDWRAGGRRNPRDGAADLPACLSECRGAVCLLESGLMDRVRGPKRRAVARHLLRGAAALLRRRRSAGCAGDQVEFLRQRSVRQQPCAAAAPGQQPAAIGAGQVKVGLILPLSTAGNAGQVGQSMRNAAELAVAEFNNPGYSAAREGRRRHGAGRAARRAAGARRRRGDHHRSAVRAVGAGGGAGRARAQRAGDRVLDRLQASRRAASIC